MTDLPDYLAFGERARLIPVAADTSREVRAASIFLATLHAVPTLAKAMLDTVSQRVGARSGLVCYTEIVFKNTSEGEKCRPDGLIVLESGRGRTWSALVEAKIGRSELDSEQVIRYATLAKTNDIQAVITISNQFAALPTHSPVKLPKGAAKGVELFHWSWMHVLTEAHLLLNANAFESAEQRFLLDEAVRYFTHPSIGISSFDRMNSEWKDLVLKIQAGAPLQKHSAEVEKSVAAWHQESRDLCLLMSRTLKRRVQLRLSRSHADDPAARLRDDIDILASTQELRCVLEVPDVAAPIVVAANLQRRSLSVTMTMEAPKDRQKTVSRVNWLLRQLTKTEPEGIQIRAGWPGRAAATQVSLAELRQNSEALDPANRDMAPNSFDIMLVRDLVGKFSGQRTFIEELERVVPEFYERAGQFLRAYVPPPPKLLRERVDDAAETSIEAPVVTAVASLLSQQTVEIPPSTDSIITGGADEVVPKV